MSGQVKPAGQLQVWSGLVWSGLVRSGRVKAIIEEVVANGL
jgi:hypothetical protein